MPALEALTKEYDVVTVVTQPDKPVGRKQVLTPPPVKLKAENLKLKVLQPEKLRSNPEFVEGLKNLNADIGIVAAYGKLIPPEIFNLPEHGILVVHPSLLPKYRGPSPVQAAILNGDEKTGVTIMKIDEEMDHGDIISSAKYQIPDDVSFNEINNGIWQLGAELLTKTLPDYLVGKIKARAQDHSQATFTKKFITADGEIKPGDTAEIAYNKIRALNPEPGTYFLIYTNGKPTRLKILAAKLAHDKNSGSGLFEINGQLALSLQNGCILLETVQLEGGRPLSGAEFVHGHRNLL